jgi:peroxiredoxin
LLLALVGCSADPSRGSGVQVPAVPTSDRFDVHGAFDYGWSVRTPDGRVRPLDDYRGRVLVLNVWATWCPPCVAELASLEALAAAVADLDVDVLLVSPEDPGTVATFAARHGYDLPLLTEDRRVPQSLGPLVLPTTFVVDRDGRIVLRHRGAADWSDPAVTAFVRALHEEPSAPEAGR